MHVIHQSSSKAKMASKAMMTAKELLEKEQSSAYRPIPTFVQSLDEILGGGIKLGALTEVYGESGVGKTTLCCQLCLDVQIPKMLQGLEAQALFIDTENSVVANRLREMAKIFAMHCNSIIPKPSAAVKLSEQRLMSSIHIVKCKSLSEFEKIVLSLEDYISRNHRIKLIVIDSIAFPYYSQDDTYWKHLYSIAQVLHFVAGKYGIAVVLTNNVTTRFDKLGNEFYVPFLGESWSHVANQRISLSWGTQGRTRVAEIVKSAYSPRASVNYRVTAAGIRE